MTHQEHHVEFTGNAKEYFGIWIVNVLLTIVTLGIYGAWAKVRDKKYFYGNTVIDNHNFDYHATGKQILIGRIIVLILVGGLSVLNVIDPVLYLIGLLVLLIILPWIIVRALSFNARVSSYRNVRFNFVGSVGDAFITYFLIPIGNVFTLYLCTPFVSRASHRFTTNNHQYGDRNFQFWSGVGPYYAAFLIALLLVILGSVVVSFAGFGSMGSLMDGLDEQDPTSMYSFLIAFYAILIFVFVPASLFYRARLRNILFNNTTLDDVHGFRSEVHAGTFIWIAISNAIIALLTIGLMIPWGRVRLAKYMASVTTVLSDGSLDGYTSNVQDTAGVISSEYMDLEGFDIDIGL